MEKQKLNQTGSPALQQAAVSGSFFVGQKVKTIHDEEAEIVGIYDGKYPYVVRKIREGKAYLSDYSASQLMEL